MRNLRKSGCFNSPIPPDMTSTLRDRISAIPSSPKGDYLKAEIFSKYVDESTDPADVRRTRAINKWLATERENEATNERLLTTRDGFQILPHVKFAYFVQRCRNIISDIIGDVVPEDALIGSFSGGASTSRPRTSSHPAGKYLGQADVTGPAYEVFEDLLDDIPGWDIVATNTVFRVVPGNVLFTVPKKTDIDRCACKEPDINMWLQKGLGAHIRKCLARTGINLNDQSINRSLARKGSFDGSLATLDLSSASDSVSRELVALLLPENWFTLLDSVRSHVTIIDGEEHRNEMFSSMGNGFTFELESLLFYALARATSYCLNIPGRVSVYGDDIIVPTALAEPLVWVLSYFGFSTNEEKSFVTGPFRESCGGHYLDGNDVTPFYVKAPLKTVADIIDVANKLRRWAQIPGLSVLDPTVEAIWLWLKSLVPSRLWGGGDLAFKYQLVSYDTSSHRLVEDTKSVSTHEGGYFHWLNATWDRTELREGVSTSSRTKSVTEQYRIRPVRMTSVPQLPHLFLHEIGVMPSILGGDPLEIL